MLSDDVPLAKQGKPRSKTSPLLILVTVVSVLLALSLVVAASVGAFNSGEANRVEDEDNEIEELNGFCAEFGISDSTVRESIAGQFLDGVLPDPFNNGIVRTTISGSDITCLPEDALGDLTREQGVLLAEAITGLTVNAAVVAVHPNAFVTVRTGVNLFEKVRNLEFRNFLTESLPDNLFRSFTSLETLRITNSQLVSLDNNIFGEELGSLDRFQLSNSEALVVLPAAFQFIPNLGVYDLSFSPLLAEIPEGIFDDVPVTFNTLNLIETPLSDLGKAALANLTGLPEEFIIS